MYHTEVSEFPAGKSEVSDVLSLIGFWRRMWLEALLRKIGPSFETDELLWLRSNMFKNDTKKLVGEIEDAHGGVETP
jgi:hypothetical protein